MFAYSCIPAPIQAAPDGVWVLSLDGTEALPVTEVLLDDYCVRGIESGAEAHQWAREVTRIWDCHADFGEPWTYT